MTVRTGRKYLWEGRLWKRKGTELFCFKLFTAVLLCQPSAGIIFIEVFLNKFNNFSPLISACFSYYDQQMLICVE